MKHTFKTFFLLTFAMSLGLSTAVFGMQEKLKQKKAHQKETRKKKREQKEKISGESLAQIAQIAQVVLKTESLLDEAIEKIEDITEESEKWRNLIEKMTQRDGLIDHHRDKISDLLDKHADTATKVTTDVSTISSNAKDSLKIVRSMFLPAASGAGLLVFALVIFLNPKKAAEWISIFSTGSTGAPNTDTPS